ncbi:arginine--tRNA ligase [Thiomicrorhabdus xiamenensis]|uniref:Arginine--tRNA ligase n=1 Tax=Thiomicrorhabdus xiamenensis TaxID=2739063 RepID=A0A7D4P3Q1_9GAMM|nr:arginine--tRNA ligase [Thiomicrorhabdus xiamenensis]QKI88315.1 arginine--tRNA ligase [Thiomicrorhabdus xiamenensis]
MKQQLAQILTDVVQQLKDQGVIPADAAPRIHVENTRDKAHGDFATNLAMMMTKMAGMPPRDLAQKIVDLLSDHPVIEKVEIAGPGFINFFVQDTAKFDVLAQVFEQGDAFGRCNVGQGKSVLVEFVSANPTGPLHVGHGRGAAYGASVANLLDAAGFDVCREYYVNDAGRQMDILATSVWLRYLQDQGEELTFPSNGYKGDYILDVAAEVRSQFGNRLHKPAFEVFANVTPDEGMEDGDKEKHIDALIERAKNLLGSQYYDVFQIAVDAILGDIRDDLEGFKVRFDNWFSERSLMDTGVIDAALEKLQKAGKIYEQRGALWFRSTEYGDEKDRVVVRENGLKTYFASDIAYHFNKLERGFDLLIDIWGSDHHGYIPRVRAAMQAMETNPDALEVLLVQFAVLYRSGEKVAMSTRSGQFVTLRELRDEVGSDAARFFYVQRKSEQHMDFDLDLAKSQSNDNPVYYIQYAHARICRVLEQASEKGYSFDLQQGMQNLELLTEEHETYLATELAKYPEIIARSAVVYEPHQIAYYLKDLANGLHTYYNASQFIVDDDNLRHARLTLISAVRQVLRNGLALLDVSAPESM